MNGKVPDSKIPYTNNPLRPRRRITIPVRVGNAQIGGDAPILVQSMTLTNTRDIEATVTQTLDLARVGCELVRITAPTVKDAEALEQIVARVHASGCKIPISADIHFQPRAAFEALKWVSKVRINPGNFCDSGIMTLKPLSDGEFAAGQQKVVEQFTPLVREAKRRGVALRIGTNHGSLSARMLYRYGDTVEGMVESALEYLRVCVAEDFDQVIFSMKASNPRVAVQAYRLLAARLQAEGHKPYPFHVGVTEAGEGEDGRIKSAVGIGALLLDGIGDTVRVSLTEDPVAEIPVARDLIDLCGLPLNSAPVADLPDLPLPWDPYHYQRRFVESIAIGDLQLGSEHPIRVGIAAVDCTAELTRPGDRRVEFVDGGPGSTWQRLSLAGVLQSPPAPGPVEIFVQNRSQLEVEALESAASLVQGPLLWSFAGENFVAGTRALAARLYALGRNEPLVLRISADSSSASRLRAAAQLGALLCDGLGDAIVVENAGNGLSSMQLAYDILQGCGLRRTKTEFISCPGCGRTLFDLQKVLAQIKERTSHLKGVSIAVMGCIVNGPGEMADADFGYVGGAPGHISLYYGKTPVQKNIPQDKALDALVQLIKDKGRWQEANSQATQEKS